MELTRSEDKSKAYRQAAEQLVAQMTLSEKCSQTLNWAPAIDRLGIKAYNWWNEALHGVARAGVATIFPQAVTLAGSFDEDLVEEVADAISTEGRAKYNNQQKYNDTDIYKGLTFWSPNVNIFRDPRWGRGHETFGEDPYLTSRLGVRFIEGIQGHDEHYLKAAACAKHFAVHSGPEELRHCFNAEVSMTDLYETYLPAFRACVCEAHVEAVMGAYNRTNGEPCCGSDLLLRKILREKWGFKGHVVSDCWAIRDFFEGHLVVDSAQDAVALAMNNGCDLNCGDLFSCLEEVVKAGKVSEARVDEAVTNLYTTRMKLGTLGEARDNPYDRITFPEADAEPMRALNLKAAMKSMVLLKNENGMLPLDPDRIRTIGVIGPNADNRKALVGNYEGTSSEYVTILEGLRDYIGDRARILYSQGCHLYKKKVENLGVENDRIAEVKGVCEYSDVVICCMGLDASLEGEQGDESNQYASGDKPGLGLPGLQQEVLETVAASGKPIILVLLSGSALTIGWADEHIPAILYGGYPGAQGGRAIAKLLFGDASPEGKLPFTFYRTEEELPAFTDYSMKGRTYRYMEHEALYPFGYGLSYTSFALDNVTLSSDRVTPEGIRIGANLTNTGSRDGAQTVQIYIRAEQPDAPRWQMKALKKVFLHKGESQHVELELTDRDFALYNAEGSKIVYQGAYKVYVGMGQPDERTAALTGYRSAEYSVHADETYTAQA